MQRAQSDDEFRHADLSSNPLILDRPDRCNRRTVHAPKRFGEAAPCHLCRRGGRRQSWIEEAALRVAAAATVESGAGEAVRNLPQERRVSEACAGSKQRRKSQ